MVQSPYRRPSRTVAIALKALLVLTSTVLAYGALESGYRIHAYAKLRSTYNYTAITAVDAPAYVFDHDLGYRYRANAAFDWFNIDAAGAIRYRNATRVNNAGHISSHDNALDSKPAGEFRIAFLGDSFTAQVVSDVTWVDVLEDQLNANTELKHALGVQHFQAVNYGMEGVGFAQFAEVFVKQVVQESPDLVVVDFVSGDIPRKFAWVTQVDRPGGASWLLWCWSLPATLENRDCHDGYPVLDPATVTEPARVRAVTRAMFDARVQLIPWFAPWPYLLQSLAKRDPIAARAAALLPTPYFFIDPQEAIAVGLASLQRIAVGAPRLLALHTPIADEFGPPATEDYKVALNLLQRSLMNGSMLDYVLMAPVLRNRGSDITRLFNAPIDVHFSNYGAREYGAAVAGVLRGYLTSDHTMGRPRPVNVAAHRRASQSSTEPGMPPERAVDGNPDGDAGHASVASTRREHQPWWEVDLGGVRVIDLVRVHTRTDCCAERLHDFVVSVSNEPLEADDPVVPRAGASRYRIENAASSGTTIPIGVLGRYVRVQLVGTDYLSLAEVEVMGRTWSILEQVQARQDHASPR